MTEQTSLMLASKPITSYVRIIKISRTNTQTEDLCNLAEDDIIQKFIVVVSLCSGTGKCKVIY